MKRRAAILAVATTAVMAAGPTAHAAQVGPTPHDYGSQNVGTSTGPTTFTLYNSGNICLSSSFPGTCDTSSSYYTDTSALGTGPGGTVTSGDFAVHNINCLYPHFDSQPAVSDAGSTPQNCQFEVSFAPTTGGALSKTLTFTDSGGPTATLSLTGTGLAPAAAAAPTPTGQRTTAIKRCKKKFPKGSARRKKCLKHARKLPV